MAENASVSKVVDALEWALASAKNGEIQSAGVDDAPRQFRYAFCCGEAGGIAAASALFGVKALELCDDISDAVEDRDTDFLRGIIDDLKGRPSVGAANRSELVHITSLPVLAAALTEAVTAYRSGDRERFALMSGFAVGLLFADPEPGPELTPAEVVEGAIHYHRGDGGTGNIGSGAC